MRYTWGEETAESREEMQALIEGFIWNELHNVGEDVIRTEDGKVMQVRVTITLEEPSDD